MAIASGSFTGQRVPFVTSLALELGRRRRTKAPDSQIDTEALRISICRQVKCCKQMIATCLCS